MSVAAWLAETEICICAGPGGVGKTTVAAAVALGLAARGQRVAVVTIDPARRLADALGVEAVGSDPRRVDTSRFAEAGLDVEHELWAMTLDPKRTFDELVDDLAPDAQTRDRILANRIYHELSTAVAGSQEFTAVAKLYELHRSGRFDVIVLDTPPSRNALDFLDAPGRLAVFFEGRGMRMMMAPTSAAAGLAARGTGLVLGALRRLTGAPLLDDLDELFRALGGLSQTFGRRAAAAGALLEAPTTSFIVIASPERPAAREATFLHARLRERGLRCSGVIVNRMHPPAARAVTPDVAALAAELGGDSALAARVHEAYGELHALAVREATVVHQLAAATGSKRPLVVPDFEDDVHDAAGLVELQRQLFAAPAERAERLARAAF
jgi:anion-transporting  ArsA/GET3 family ATPase